MSNIGFKVIDMHGYRMGIHHWDDTPPEGVLTSNARTVFRTKEDAVIAIKRTIKYRKDNDLPMWNPENYKEWNIQPLTGVLK